jgi:hypothetical protein
MSSNFMKVLKDNNITLQTSAPYKHQQNFVERYIQIFKNGVRTIMAYNNTPKDLWCFAVETFIHVYNRVPRKGSTTSPDEKFFGKKPDVSSFVPFYSTGYYNVTKEEKREGPLKQKAKKCHMLSYASDQFIESKNCYKVLCEDRSIKIRHDCYFAFYPESESLLNEKEKREEVSKSDDRDVEDNDPFVPVSKKRQREDTVKPTVPVVD